MQSDDFKRWGSTLGLSQTKAAEALGISKGSIETTKTIHEVSLEKYGTTY